MYSRKSDPGTELLARWSAASAEWLTRRDAPDLPELVDQALRQVVAFDLSIIFAYPAGDRPRLLFDGLRKSMPRAPLAAYINGTYLLDPFYLACASNPPLGLYRMSDFAPDAFFESEYFNSWQVHPCISMDSGSLAEEIGYFFRLPCGALATYSLMRSNGQQIFQDSELTVLRAVEPQVRLALCHHWRAWGMAAEMSATAEATASLASGALEHAFASFAAAHLTPQQRRIVQLILRGHSNASMGRLLNITEGTVKNHRHQIYERLGIGAQSELFALFVKHLGV
jgi:DNA-binding CsgD family transcriptional regulator